MSYSLTPPLALEAAYLATSAPAGLPFNLVCLTCDWWRLTVLLNWLLRCCFTGPLVPSSGGIITGGVRWGMRAPGL